MQLIEIKNDGSPDPEIPLTAPAIEVCESTAARYRKEGFVPPWIGYLAVVGSQIVGTCAFKSPPRSNRVEISYFTFPQHDEQDQLYNIRIESWNQDPRSLWIEGVGSFTQPIPAAEMPQLSSFLGATYEFVTGPVCEYLHEFDTA